MTRSDEGIQFIKELRRASSADERADYLGLREAKYAHEAVEYGGLAALVAIDALLKSARVLRRTGVEYIGEVAFTHVREEHVVWCDRGWEDALVIGTDREFIVWLAERA